MRASFRGHRYGLFVIVVMCTFDVDPADRDAFVASRKISAAESCAEDGCLEYAFSLDVLDPGRVRLNERWESEETFAAHIKGMQGKAGGSDIPLIGRSIRIIDGTERS